MLFFWVVFFCFFALMPAFKGRSLLQLLVKREKKKCNNNINAAICGYVTKLSSAKPERAGGGGGVKGVRGGCSKLCDFFFSFFASRNTMLLL